jgi:hypothetical protein
MTWKQAVATQKRRRLTLPDANVELVRLQIRNKITQHRVQRIRDQFLEHDVVSTFPRVATYFVGVVLPSLYLAAPGAITVDVDRQSACGSHAVETSCASCEFPVGLRH